MASHEFIVTGDPTRAKQTAVDSLQSRGFRVGWTDDWTAVAEKGSRTKNLLLGAFAQYFKVGIAVRTYDAHSSVIRLEPISKGYAGGLWGAAKTRKNHAAVRDELRATFQQAGVLVADGEVI